jgi:hypothetical protein
MPRELIVFLVQFSAALNKTRAYPQGHPVLKAGMDLLLHQLRPLLETRDVLAVGVSAGQLLVEGAVSDPNHPVLKDLSERLHLHQLAALRFTAGVEPAELGDLLVALADETWRQGKPLGLESAEVLERRWAHVQLEPLPLEHLELGGREGPAGDQRVEKLWQGLASAVLGPGGLRGLRNPDGRGLSASDLAGVIAAKIANQDGARAFVDWLLASEEGKGSGSESAVRQQFTSLLDSIDPPTLQKALVMGSDSTRRRNLILATSRTLPLGAVLELVRFSSVTDGTISHPVLRIFTKLADHTDMRSGAVLPGAEQTIRESVRQLMTDWTGDERTPGTYRRLLELLARPGRSEPGTAGADRGAEAARMVQMGLELRATSPGVLRAMDELADSAGLGTLCDLHDRAEPSPATVALWERVANRERLGKAVLAEQADEAELDRLFDRLGPKAADALLDALEVAESASRRRWVLGRVVRFGGAIRETVVGRLPGKPWYVQRNLLGLLDTVGLPEGFTAWEYAGHEDPRVRREGFKLLLKAPETRGPALLKGVADVDSGIALMALTAAVEAVPPELPLRLLELLRTRYRDPDLRVQAIRCFDRRPSPASRDWLLVQVAGKRGWFGRRKLQPKSPELLAGLAVLAHHWSAHTEAARVLAQARAHRDPEIRAVAREGLSPA